MRIPVQSSVLVRQRHRYEFGNVFPVMAGDCGDEIPSKSKPQSADVTSCANFENVLYVRYLHIFVSVILHFPRISRIFSRLVICNGFLLIFQCATTRFRQSWWSLRQFLFLLKQQLLSFCFHFVTQLFQCSTAEILLPWDQLSDRATCRVINSFQGLRTENHLLILLLQLVHVTAYKCRKVAGGSSVRWVLPLRVIPWYVLCKHHLVYWFQLANFLLRLSNRFHFLFCPRHHFVYFQNFYGHGWPHRCTYDFHQYR